MYMWRNGLIYETVFFWLFIWYRTHAHCFKHKTKQCRKSRLALLTSPLLIQLFGYFECTLLPSVSEKLIDFINKCIPGSRNPDVPTLCRRFDRLTRESLISVTVQRKLFLLSKQCILRQIKYTKCLVYL